MSTLLVGNATIFTVANANSAGLIEAYQFTALQTGTVDTLQFRTSGTANTGVTSLLLGIYSDAGGVKPTAGAALGSGTFTGTPAINSWISVSGLSVSVTSGTVYWLGALVLGGSINNWVSVASGGTRVCDSVLSNHTTMDMSSDTWGTASTDGPAGFQGLSTTTTARAFTPGRMPLGA